MCSSIQLFKAIGGVCYLSKIRLVFVGECVEGGFLFVCFRFCWVFLIGFVLLFIKLVFYHQQDGTVFLNNHEQKEFHPENSLGQGVLAVNSVFPISLRESQTWIFLSFYALLDPVKI